MSKIKEVITVLVSGKFTLLHPGHFRLLKFAKECGHKLIVALDERNSYQHSDLVDDKTRLENILDLNYVDEAFLYSGPIEDLISQIKPDIVVKGKEHESQYNPELEILKLYGGKLIFSSGESTFSSFNLLKLEEGFEILKGDSNCKKYMERNNVTFKSLRNAVENFSRLNICVLGDVIVDEYVECEALGMSQEDPTIVVSEILSEKFVGGAGIVASHAASLGAKVDFYSLAAEDENRSVITDKLSKLNIDFHLYTEPGRPTTLKKRYRCGGKTLLRVSKLHQNSITTETKEKIYLNIKKNISKYNALIFSDFNYGCLPQDLVDKIIKLCLKNKVVVAADSQSSSQLGDITRFNGIDLITPTEREARIALKNREDGLPILGERLLKLTNCKYVVLKLGFEGIIVFSGGKIDGGGEPLPAINRSAIDPSGAGDSLLVLTTMLLSLNKSIWDAAYLGSIAAAIQVGRRGNIPLNCSEISFYLR